MKKTILTTMSSLLLVTIIGTGIGSAGNRNVRIAQVTASSVPTVKLASASRDWGTNPQTMTYDDVNDVYTLSGVFLSKDDSFKFIIGSDWKGVDDSIVTETGTGDVIQGYGSGNNLWCKTEGVYNLFLKLTDGDPTALEIKNYDIASPRTVYFDIGNSTWDVGAIPHFFAHYWGGTSYTTWPGVPMSSDSSIGSLFSLEIPSDTTTIIFNINLSGYENQTEDVIVEGGKNLYKINGYDGDGKKTGTWSLFGSKTINVLDLSGKLLDQKANLHVFDENDNGTAWPGITMSKVAETHNIYSASFYDKMTSAIVNQIGAKNDDESPKTGQSVDLNITGKEDKVLLLNQDEVSEYKWSSNTWVSLETARFIDGYMKFETAWTNIPGTGLCSAYGWYEAAKTAYNAIKDDAGKSSILAEINSVEIVTQRLEKWAIANGESFTVGAGFVAPSPVGTIDRLNDAGNAFFIAIIAALGLVSVCGLFFIKHKQSE